MRFHVFCPIIPSLVDITQKSTLRKIRRSSSECSKSRGEKAQARGRQLGRPFTLGRDHSREIDRRKFQ
jgi:hypothetical protein